ncbi:MAG TPA: S26 family signal peptidase, partial [Candidatus Bilamarchaeaceae archaeon]|nr:S26 family signal peptidase [Candidatus Bilamarchaeaceae archaeon]
MGSRPPGDAKPSEGIAERLSTDWVAQFALIGITLALYVFTKNPIFGILVLLEIILIVALEIRHGIRKHGLKHELKDILVSLIAILAIWFAAMVVMQTPVPLNAVVSCSMLPNIERGDMVLVQGSAPAGYEVEITPEELAQLNGHPSVHLPSGSTISLKGSLYTYCAQYPSDP